MHYQIPPHLTLACPQATIKQNIIYASHRKSLITLLIKSNINSSANIDKAYKRHNMYIWDQVACMLKNPTSPRIMCISHSHVFRL